MSFKLWRHEGSWHLLSHMYLKTVASTDAVPWKSRWIIQCHYKHPLKLCFLTERGIILFCIYGYVGLNLFFFHFLMLHQLKTVSVTNCNFVWNIELLDDLKPWNVRKKQKKEYFREQILFQALCVLSFGSKIDYSHLQTHIEHVHSKIGGNGSDAKPVSCC